MKLINIKRCARQVLVLNLAVMLIASYSTVTFASPTKPLGEIIVSAKSPDGAASVTVNGEPTTSGRTIFASSTIATPADSGATINLGRAGKLQLAPNTTFTLEADGTTIGGNLTSGSLTVLSSAQSVGVRTLAGDLVSLSAGETATAVSTKAARDYRDKTTGKCIDDDNDGKEECSEGLPMWGWYVIGGGIIAAVVIAVAVSGDDDQQVNVSPVR